MRAGLGFLAECAGLGALARQHRYLAGLPRAPVSAYSRSSTGARGGTLPTVMRAGLGLLALASVIACRPAELRVEPAQGDGDGGQLVRLVGAEFLGHGPVVVYFGPRSARAVVIEDDAHIAVKTPEAEAFGPVDVRAEFADGTTLELPAGYTYVQVEGKPLKPILFKPGTTPVPTAE